MPIYSVTETQVIVDCDGCKRREYPAIRQTYNITNIKVYVGRGNDEKIYMKFPRCPQCGGIMFCQPSPETDSAVAHLKRCLAAKLIRDGQVQYIMDATQDQINEDNIKLTNRVDVLNSFYVTKGNSTLTNEFNGTTPLDISTD